MEQMKEYADEVARFESFHKEMFLKLWGEICFPEDMDFTGQFVQAHEQRCVKAMWSVWCRTAEKFLATKASEATGYDQILIDRRYFERGFGVEPKRVQDGRAPESKNGVFVDPKRRELLKPVDILDEISTLRPISVICWKSSWTRKECSQNASF